MKPAYSVLDGWEQIPDGIRHLDVADVAVASNDDVFVLTRMDPQVLVYDSEGRFRSAWGSDVLSARPHGLTVASDDTLYCVDEGAQFVFHFTRDGELLGSIGDGSLSDTGVDWSRNGLYERTLSIQHGGAPFNHPTKLSPSNDGSLFVSDGYGNARVHKFDSSGELLLSWGEPGTAQGEFRVPHSVLALEDGRVLVADRENDRVQVFTNDGSFVEEWTHVQRPTDITTDGRFLYVAENSWFATEVTFRNGVMQEDRPGRVSVLNQDGSVVERFGGPTGSCWDPFAPGQFAAPHGIAVDSAGSLYVAEVTFTHFSHHGGVPENFHALQKFVRR